MSVDRAILLCDISGSTPLYEQFGDERASRIVHDCVKGMQDTAVRGGGEFVRSKGDDVLCLFEDPARALITARDMLDHGTAGSVSVHGGLHFGTVLWRGTELFGGAVNVAARLSGRSRANEVLLSGAFVERISPEQASELRPMGEMTLKGTEVPTSIYALLAANEDGITRLVAQPEMNNLTQRPADGPAAIKVTFLDAAYAVTEGQEIRIGRSPECHLIIPEPWVSRIHATLTARGGLVEFTDRSAGGCSLTFGSTIDFFIRRQTVALTGSGTIELAGAAQGTALPCIQFEITTS